jgi:hypothetical protein
MRRRRRRFQRDDDVRVRWGMHGDRDDVRPSLTDRIAAKANRYRKCRGESDYPSHGLKPVGYVRS